MNFKLFALLVLTAMSSAPSFATDNGEIIDTYSRDLLVPLAVLSCIETTIPGYPSTVVYNPYYTLTGTGKGGSTWFSPIYKPVLPINKLGFYIQETCPDLKQWVGQTTFEPFKGGLEVTPANYTQTLRKVVTPYGSFSGQFCSATRLFQDTEVKLPNGALFKDTQEWIIHTDCK
jgi:hypothetical protein